MPQYLYPYDTYPDYLNGVGYLISMDAVPQLYKVALASTYVHLEDVFITGNTSNLPIAAILAIQYINTYVS